MDRFIVPKYTIIKYLRNSKGEPRGVIVAVKLPGGGVSVNYSYCNSKLDKFNKQTGLRIAIGRALNNSNVDENVTPRQVIKEIESFNERICRYYKVHKEHLYTW